MSDNFKSNYHNMKYIINSLNTCLKVNPDIFAPIKTTYFKIRRNKPWFNSSTSQKMVN